MTFESNHDFWTRMLEEMGRGVEFFSPQPPEREEVSFFPLTLYRGTETCTVLDEEEAEQAAEHGFFLHPSMEEQNAKQKPETGQDDGSSGTRPGVCSEAEDSSEGGEGV